MGLTTEEDLVAAVRAAEWEGDGTDEQAAAHDAACVALRDYRAARAPYQPPPSAPSTGGARFGTVIITAEGAD